MCREWREVGRLVWSSRRCVAINAKTMPEANSRAVDRVVLDKHLLDKLFVTKNVGLKLRSFHINWHQFDRVSLDALAQHCPNLEHLDLKQVYLHILLVSKNNWFALWARQS